MNSPNYIDDTDQLTDLSMPDEHEPFSHSDCSSCQETLFNKITEGTWDQEGELLRIVAPLFFNHQLHSASEVYKHFHPRYNFNRDDFNKILHKVALPGSKLGLPLLPGDIIVAHHSLSGRSRTLLIVNAALLNDQIPDPTEKESLRSGYYIKVYGPIHNWNEQFYFRICDPRGIVVPDVVIIRKRAANPADTFLYQPIPDYDLSDDFIEDEFTRDDLQETETAPALLGRETTPGLETMYINIPLGLSKECYYAEIKEKDGKPEIECKATLKKAVEAKTGVYIPQNFTPGNEIDLLIYLHGHKTKYIDNDIDVSIDKLWTAAVQPKFLFREILNESGRNLILAAPTLGPRSQPGTLITDDGFTSFINQVLLALKTHCSLFSSFDNISVRSIILAAHSGGGSPMRKIATLPAANHYAQLIQECWGFDCTYSGSADYNGWYSWAKAYPAKKIYIYSIPGKTTARTANRLASLTPALPNIFVENSRTDDHNSVPGMYMKERLNTPASQPVTTESYMPEQFLPDEYDGEENYFYEDTPLPINVSDPPAMIQNIPFAPAPPAGSFWPIRTADSNGRLVSYKSATTGRYFGNTGRSFLASRDQRKYNGNLSRYRGTIQDRWHVGIDLFADFNDEVVACENGTIIRFDHFYDSGGGHPTNRLLIQHGNIVVNYGEVGPSSLRRTGKRVGDTVTAGEVIAYVGATGMLHFETYTAGTDTTVQWWKIPETPNPPSNLLNPTQYLLSLQEHGEPLQVTTPATTSISEFIGESQEDQLKEKERIQKEIVRISEEELSKWRNKRTREMRTDVIRYWMSGAGLNSREAGEWFDSGAEWSAAFVSYVMRAGTNDVFRASTAHNRYTVWANENATQRPAIPFRIFRISEVTVEVGDIIINARESGSRPIADFDSIIDPDAGRKAHGDIVIAVNRETNIATVFGGNKGYPGVKSVPVDLTADGKVAQINVTKKSGKGTYEKFIAVVKLMPSTENSLALPESMDIYEDWYEYETDTTAEDEQLYGGNNLQRGDSDRAGKYSGVVVPANTGKHHVADLQSDLQKLGFNFGLGSPNGEFDADTMHALKEFQLHAKMEHIAKQTGTTTIYSDSLSTVVNTSVYTGPVSGVANAATRALIQLWLQNDWRCPVVIEAWDMNGSSLSAIMHMNLWKYDDLHSTRPRMFARDFSNYYQNQTRRIFSDRQVLGDYHIYSSWSGPRSVPPLHCWTEAEIMPNQDLFSGINPAMPIAGQLNGSQFSTFRVIRAVAEVEPEGFYDGINAYDKVYISVGPFHMPIGEVNDGSGGELGGFMAFFMDQEPAEFEKLFGFCGVKAFRNWNGNGRSIFRSSGRFTSTMALQNDNGSFSELLTPDREPYHWFRSWHWFYRFAMAGRTSPIYRKALWNYSRIRLRTLLNTVWDNSLEVQVTNASGTTRRPATIGDIFTSEKAVATIYRWHVKSPSNIVFNSRAGRILREVVRTAGINLSSPLTITLTDEQRLVDILVRHVDAPATTGSVANWPEWVPASVNPAARGRNSRNFNLDIQFCQPLSSSRNVNGFPLDTSGLTPAP